jgi:beta-galactosidase
MKNLQLVFIALVGLFFCIQPSVAQKQNGKSVSGNTLRQRISINNDWSFYKYESISKADNLIYDVRPDVTDHNDNKAADSKPTEAVAVEVTQEVLKPWILPSGNRFIKDSLNHYNRPKGNPGSDFPFVQNNFDDHSWENVNLPHDWAIKGPFQKGWNAEVGGGMGRLPVNGVAWYRKKLNIPASDKW